MKTNILPRQARDKHRESSKKTTVLCTSATSFVEAKLVPQRLDLVKRFDKAMLWCDAPFLFLVIFCWFSRLQCGLRVQIMTVYCVYDGFLS
jgi:hypothetical protein